MFASIFRSAGSMPKTVKMTFKEIIQEEGGMNAEQAQQYIEQLEKEKRYNEDTWS